MTKRKLSWKPSKTGYIMFILGVAVVVLAGVFIRTSEYTVATRYVSNGSTFVFWGHYHDWTGANHGGFFIDNTDLEINYEPCDSVHFTFMECFPEETDRVDAALDYAEKNGYEWESVEGLDANFIPGPGLGTPNHKVVGFSGDFVNLTRGGEEFVLSFTGEPVGGDCVRNLTAPSLIYNCSFTEFTGPAWITHRLNN